MKSILLDTLVGLGVIGALAALVALVALLLAVLPGAVVALAGFGIAVLLWAWLIGGLVRL